jgi:hypothetical protein
MRPESSILELQTRSSSSSIAVPMLKKNELIGAFFIYRTEVRPFTDKHAAR